MIIVAFPIHSSIAQISSSKDSQKVISSSNLEPYIQVVRRIASFAFRLGRLERRRSPADLVHEANVVLHANHVHR
jgi:hypothetical protein